MNLKYLSLNYSQTWWYKVLAILLVVALILAVSFGTVQHAGAIAITATVAAAILAVMAGAGIYTVVSGMTSSQIQNWVSDKLDDWDLSRNDGHDWTYYIDHNLIVSTVLGDLKVGAAAASGISDFLSFLSSDLNLQENVPVPVVDSLPNFAGYNMLVVPASGSSSSLPGVSSDDGVPGLMYFCMSSSGQGGNICFISEVPAHFRTWAGVSYTNQYLNGYYYSNGFGYTLHEGNALTGLAPPSIRYTEVWPADILSGSDLTFSPGGGLTLNPGDISIPVPSEDEDIYIGVPGTYPGINVDDLGSIILDGVVTNTLDVDMDVSSEYIDAQEVVIVNEQPLTVNTDHHGFAFDLPDITFNFSSIWHYVTDAVSYASGFISWFVGFLSSVPALAIPLYMSFTLVVVLGALRRFVL